MVVMAIAMMVMMVMMVKTMPMNDDPDRFDVIYLCIIRISLMLV